MSQAIFFSTSIYFTTSHTGVNEISNKCHLIRTDSARSKIAVDRTKILSENEWLNIINGEERSQDISEEERRKLAEALAYHFMTIDDALELTEQQLVS
jgi:hypothetical protein